MTFMPNDPSTGRPHGFRPYSEQGDTFHANCAGTRCTCDQPQYTAAETAAMIIESIQRHDDPALAAMLPPSSLNVHRELSGQKAGRDVVREAQLRAMQNFDAERRGTLPGMNGLCVTDGEPASDAEILAMVAPSSLAVFNSLKRR